MRVSIVSRRLEVECEDRSKIRATIPVDQRLTDIGVSLQEVFQILRRDILAASGDDEILLPVGDAQKAVVVDLANISGGKPPILQKYLGRLCWPLVIAFGNVGATGEDFPVEGEAQFHT